MLRFGIAACLRLRLRLLDWLHLRCLWVQVHADVGGLGDYSQERMCLCAITPHSPRNINNSDDQSSRAWSENLAELLAVKTSVECILLEVMNFGIFTMNVFISCRVDPKAPSDEKMSHLRTHGT